MSADRFKMEAEATFVAELPAGVLPSLRLVEVLVAAAQVKGKPLSEIEVLALMDSPSQAVH